MKKLLVLLLVMSFVISPVFATFSRIAGLGVNNWMIEEDDNLIWLNPARIGNYAGNVWCEWPGAAPGIAGAPRVNNIVLNNAWGGISKELDIIDNLTASLFVGRGYTGALTSIGGLGFNAGNNDPAFSDAAGIGTTALLFTNLFALAPVGKYDVLLSYSADIADIGAALTYASFSQNDKNLPLNSGAATGPIPAGTLEDTEELKSSDMGIAIGARKNDIGPISSLDVVVSMNMLNAENTEDRNQYVAVGAVTTARDSIDNKFELDNGMNLNIAARAVIEKDDVKKILFLNYLSQDVSNRFTTQIDANLDGTLVNPVDTDRIQTREEKNTTLSIGAAMNKNISEKTLLICALSYNQTKTIVNAEEENKNVANIIGVYEAYNWEQIRTTLPLNLAVEHVISKAVTTRLGIAKNIMNKRTVTIDDPDYILNAAGTAWVEDYGDASMEDVNDLVGAAVVTVGVGIKPLKNLIIDVLVRQQLLFTGGFLASGIPETFAGQVTATLKY